MSRAVLFLSDYGLQDEYVGVCHAVMARLAPEARVIDLTHGLPPQDVAGGAQALAAAVPYAPADAVFLAVVDPGVGTARRAVVVEAGDALLVGPDNGLLVPAGRALGGVRGAFAITSERVMLHPVSATFHGRDVFAPVAAHLAAGLPPEEVGPAVDPATLHHLPAVAAEVEPGALRTWVAAVDRFGNVQLGAGPEHLDQAGLDGPEVAVRAGGRDIRSPRVRTFAEVGEGRVGLLTDSRGRLALVLEGGSFAAALSLSVGDPVEIRGVG